MFKRKYVNYLTTSASKDELEEALEGDVANETLIEKARMVNEAIAKMPSKKLYRKIFEWRVNMILYKIKTAILYGVAVCRWRMEDHKVR